MLLVFLTPSQVPTTDASLHEGDPRLEGWEGGVSPLG
jgi:hypothetical protein